MRTLKNKLDLDIKAAQAAAALAEAALAQAALAVAARPAVVKNALLIGCNYVGSDYELNGCINDVENIQKKSEDTQKNLHETYNT